MDSSELDISSAEKFSPSKLPTTSRHTISGSDLRQRLSIRSPGTEKIGEQFAGTPHGLTAKRANRRNSLHESYNDNFLTPASITVAKRYPLTSPSSNANHLNGADLSLLKQSKKSFDSKFKNLSNLSPKNKENLFKLYGKNKRASRIFHDLTPKNKSNSVATSSNSSKFTPGNFNKSMVNNIESSPLDRPKRKSTDTGIDSRRKSQKLNNDEISVSVEDFSMIHQGNKSFNYNRDNSEDAVEFHDIVSHFSETSRDSIRYNQEDPANEEASSFLQEEDITIEAKENEVDENEHDEEYYEIEDGRDGSITENGLSKNKEKEIYSNTPKSLKTAEFNSITPNKNNQALVRHSFGNSKEAREDKESSAEAISDYNIKDYFTNDDTSSEEEDNITNNLQTPNSKPIFTIKQVQTIQNGHLKDMNELEKFLFEKTKELTEISQHLSDAKITLSELEVQNRNLSSFKKQAEENNLLLNFQIQGNESELKKMRRELKVKDKTIDEKADRISRLEQASSKSNTEINKMKEDLEKLEDMAFTFKSEAEAITESSKAEIEKLSIELQGKEQEIRSLTEANSNNSHHVNELLIEKDKYTEELERAKYKQSQLEDTLSDKQQKIEDYQQQIISYVESLNQINQERDNLTQNIKQLEDENYIIKDELEQKKSEISSLKIENHELASKVGNNAITYDELNEEYQKQIAELTNLEKSYIQLKNDKNDLLDSLENLKSEYRAKADEEIELKDKVESLSTSELKLKDLLQSSREKIEALSKLIDDQDSLKDEDSNKLKEYKKLIEEYEEELNILKQEKGKSAELLVSNDEQLSITINEAKNLKVENETLREELASKISKYDMVLKENVKYRKQISQNEAKLESKLQELAQDLYIQYSQKHEQKVAVLKKGYETKWNSKLNALEFENKSLKREIESLKLQMKSERSEKNQIVKLWDQFVGMDEEKGKQK